MNKVDEVWQKLNNEVNIMIEEEPLLGSFFLQSIINQRSFARALSFQLASRLGSAIMSTVVLREIFDIVFIENESIVESAAIDLEAVVLRDPAVKKYSTPLLYLKGYHAIQAYRIAHILWENGRVDLACYLQNVISATFGVDIHPAAKIGQGIMFDHATGIVIGETAVVGDNVSFLHGVTLGGTGHEEGDRHPKIGSGVMIGAGASVLGNIKIGAGAKIGAGSVVLHPVKPHTTVAGVPAKVIGTCSSDMPAIDMDQNI